MDNKFFDFVKEYEDDIKELLKALVEFFKTVFDKLSGKTEEAE